MKITSEGFWLDSFSCSKTMAFKKATVKFFYIIHCYYTSINKKPQNLSCIYFLQCFIFSTFHLCTFNLLASSPKSVISCTLVVISHQRKQERFQAQTKIHPSVFSSQVNKGKEAGKKKEKKKKTHQDIWCLFLQVSQAAGFLQTWSSNNRNNDN